MILIVHHRAQGETKLIATHTLERSQIVMQVGDKEPSVLGVHSSWVISLEPRDHAYQPPRTARVATGVHEAMAQEAMTHQRMEADFQEDHREVDRPDFGSHYPVDNGWTG